ncbi:hypothetical protein [Thermogemmatispora tikiterensis]|uniref:Uncharacterized protein n=1 Tax=Thermogemmatispora tikiterensis TaxID=1825093 RepID=A0A328VK66_9CHLR|nr:hypothetical protein [Thermogemmatispora tikiterensis]RAQ94635.1 hypothetical protein A4R35_03750 [Thermogemmatispora tikiterensis]
MPAPLTLDWTSASWQEACEALARLTDALGTPIDPGIVETVVLLNLLGFPTVQSCEGHLDHGPPYPWVTVVDRALQQRFLQQWQQVCQFQEQAHRSGHPADVDRSYRALAELQVAQAQWKQEETLRARLIELLDAFYDQQPCRCPATRLLVQRHHPGLYRIRPVYATDPPPEALRASYLERGQEEMRAWTRSLRQCWERQRAAHAQSSLP